MTALAGRSKYSPLDPQGVGAPRDIERDPRGDHHHPLFAFRLFCDSIVTARGGRAELPLRLVRVGGDTTLWSDIEALRAWLLPQAAIQSCYAATEAPMMQWFSLTTHAGATTPAFPSAIRCPATVSR